MFNVFFIYVQLDGCLTIWIKRRYSVNVKNYKKTNELWLVDLCLTPLSILMCYLINGMFVLVDKAWMPRENHRSSVGTLTILLSYDLRRTRFLNIVRRQLPQHNVKLLIVLILNSMWTLERKTIADFQNDKTKVNCTVWCHVLQTISNC